MSVLTTHLPAMTTAHTSPRPAPGGWPAHGGPLSRTAYRHQDSNAFIERVFRTLTPNHDGGDYGLLDAFLGVALALIRMPHLRPLESATLAHLWRSPARMVPRIRRGARMVSGQCREAPQRPLGCAGQHRQR